MNPFPTRQAAETYLARIPDLAQREAIRARLGLVREESPHPPISETRTALQAPAVPLRDVPPPPPRPIQAPVPGVLTFTLPFPPSLNSLWRATVITTDKGPTARVLLSREGRQYRRTVHNVIRSLGNPTTPTGARLALTLTACPPDRRARDLSNMPKALEDALTHANVWGDDSLIDELRVIRGPITPGGRVDVTITPLTRTLFGTL
ncbi:hypothetical protein GCM10008955_00860 [Deinococcus malanensis]|uniref:Uncharacterized protein n=1 Tax=Deinococcus malanensis TaxID=1706855 RepID=A0ABQ2EGA3_9DEIO|nr:RusA family crossover junction endodeoxyribonuclease [Deinococcus malanensis]GGK11456.1 hypothetical protein GCM10008955_00860 [Deinococcus malanensis]